MFEAPAHHEIDAMEVRMHIQLTAPFKKQLLEQRGLLLAQLTALRGGQMGRAAASAEHFGQPEDSRAQVATEREMEFTLDARESAELDAIDAALKRIDAGVYGVCTDCGADIAAARLQATPQASRCIACQDKFEHRAGRGA
jgi:DnaK suppressor protein